MAGRGTPTDRRGSWRHRAPAGVALAPAGVALAPAGVALALAVALLGAAGCSGGGSLGESGLPAPAEEAPDTTDGTGEAGPRTLEAYAGVGAWVDAFDYAVPFQSPGQAPAVTPDAVGDMAALGVETLYLQAAKDDDRSPGLLVDDDLVARFLREADRHDVRVVAWYLPKLADVDFDVARLRHLLEVEVDGRRFDGVGVDIEWTQSVPDHAERNRRLVELSRRLDEVAGDDPLAAIVLPPVQTEVVNPALWPDFPWGDLAPHYDIWMPMAYWTFRDGEYRDAYTYVDESIRRLRANLDDPDLVVHPVGGIGDLATAVDYEGFVRAAREHDAPGWSIYDFHTQSSASWPHLRGP